MIALPTTHTRNTGTAGCESPYSSAPRLFWEHSRSFMPEASMELLPSRRRRRRHGQPKDDGCRLVKPTDNRRPGTRRAVTFLGPPDSMWVAIVDDDELMRGALQGLLREARLPSRAFASAQEFLNSGAQHLTQCLITNVHIPNMSNLDLQTRLNAEQIRIPIIFISAHDDDRVR